MLASIAGRGARNFLESFPMRRAIFAGVAAVCVGLGAEPITYIDMDGEFTDWAGVPSYFDPAGDPHDTDHDQPDDVPGLVPHPDVDLLEFKFTHDEENAYAYFRSAGIIGNTQHESQGRPGRFYTIVTIDVDNDDVTGYPLHEGGYYPTTPGYDMNMEVEYFNGTFNTGHYLNHGCMNEEDFFLAQEDQREEIVRVLPGTYDWYTQWVMWDEPAGVPDEIILPSGRSIVWVTDQGPAYLGGILTLEISEDGHEAEMKAPFRGFMKHPDGTPIMKLGNVIDLSYSLEASPELTGQGTWASDTADPLNGYTLDAKFHLADTNEDNQIARPEVDRVAALFSANGYHCADGTDDGFDAGPGSHACEPHSADYAPQDWNISMSEMLRTVQLHNSSGYESCRDGEDEFCIAAAG